METNCMTNVVTLQSVLEHHRSHALMVTRFRRCGWCPKKLWRPAVWSRKKEKKKRHKALVFALKSKTGDEGSKPLSHRLWVSLLHSTVYHSLEMRAGMQTPLPGVRSPVGQQILVQFLSFCPFFPPGPHVQKNRFLWMCVCVYMCVSPHTACRQS